MKTVYKILSGIIVILLFALVSGSNISGNTQDLQKYTLAEVSHAVESVDFEESDMGFALMIQMTAFLYSEMQCNHSDFNRLSVVILGYEQNYENVNCILHNDLPPPLV